MGYVSGKGALPCLTCKQLQTEIHLVFLKKQLIEIGIIMIFISSINNLN